MQNKRLKTSLFLLLGLALTIHAQDAISAAGIDISGNGGSVSFTIGQIANQTYRSDKLWQTDGVQQTYGISISTIIIDSTIQSFSAYPNPVSNSLTLETKDVFDFSSLNFQLIDEHGKLLQTGKIITKQTNISMNYFKPSVYFVKITRNNKEQIIFKIVKK